MEQESSPIQPQQQEVRPKAPIFVTIIAGLILISSIGLFLLAATILLFAAATNSGVIFGFGGLALVGGISLVAVSFGIWKMRRWGLYTFTGLAALTIFLNLTAITLPIKNFADFAIIGIRALILTITLVYLWAIHKRFN